MDLIQKLTAALKQNQPLTEVVVGIDEPDYKIVNGTIGIFDLQITWCDNTISCVVNQEKEIVYLDGDELTINEINYSHKVKASDKFELKEALCNYVKHIITK
ncbi:MAG: hypothetical protein U0M61_10385 [Succinivibrio sp.]|nr:hypothetical protein [Succinivibrio sp.]